MQAESTWTPYTIPLRWTRIPSHLLNGILTGYRIRYQATEVGQRPYKETPREVFVPAENESTVLTGLESFALYRIEITGLTIKGDGPSEVVFAGTQHFLKLLLLLILRLIALVVSLNSCYYLLDKVRSSG